MNPGLRAEWSGRKDVLVTHPLDPETACELTRTYNVPSGGKSTLRVVVAHDPQGDFELIIRVNGKGVVHKHVNKTTTGTTDPWLTEEVDLSPFVGKTVKLELINQPTGWSYEAAYWGEIALISR
jgi:hypothetical protein